MWLPARSLGKGNFVMVISAKEISQFQKLMMMTTSDNDPEALVAIRKANTILKNNKINWDEVCKQVNFNILSVKNPYGFKDSYQSSKPDYQSRPNTHYQSKPNTSSGRTTSPDILEPLQFAMDRCEGSFYDFLESLKFQFQNKGWLSEAQVAAIMKSAKRSGWRG
jgi:hypothetical protein